MGGNSRKNWGEVGENYRRNLGKGGGNSRRNSGEVGENYRRNLGKGGENSRKSLGKGGEIPGKIGEKDGVKFQEKFRERG